MWRQSIRRARQAWDALGRNPVSHWCILFVVLSITVSNYRQNANPYARYATLEALAEDHSFAINAYQSTTCDWARTPDGNYYSNKAPGPTILALPFYLPVDTLVVAYAKNRQERDLRRLEVRDAMLSYLSVVMQVIPFALLVLAVARRLADRGVSRPAIELAALAMLFGNTASLLMNMFFGHGLSAVLTLGLALALLDRRLVLAGLLFGLDVLSDYGTALFLPVLLAVILMLDGRKYRKSLHHLLRFALGGLGPLVVFAWYHKHLFGSAFTLPNKFQNPVFVEKTGKALWGVINFVPDGRITFALLFGLHRSLAITQPWVLLLVGLSLVLAWRRSFWSRPRLHAALPILPLALGGLLVLFLMNASFGGWHGGVCPGPRYLAAIFPVIGLALGLTYDSLARPLRILLWLSVLPALALFMVIWAGDQAIWPHHFIWYRCYEMLFKYPTASTYLRLAWLLFGFALTSAVAWLRLRPARDFSRPEVPRR
jgi:hypothetical protein